MGEPKEVLDRLEKEYKTQQKETSRMIREKKGNWERENIEQARRSSKAIWTTVKEVMGRTRNREVQVYLYREDMTKCKEEDEWHYFMSDWKRDI